LKQDKEQSDVVIRALAMLRCGPANDESSVIQGRVADLATTILTEAQPDEADAIIKTWKRLFNLNLDRNQVIRHLAQSRAWQQRRTRR
jgi:uncharacterized protein YmfQ (DUF2313 family)